MQYYIHDVLDYVRKRYYWQKEFLQAVTEVFDSITEVVEQEPRYKALKILERMIIPERTICFRVPWEDDQGHTQVSTGYRIEFSSNLGPYKGGLRFHSSVNESILKFLAFEQIFKNALTGLPMGAGKGGADFNFRGRSDNEIRRFCQSFMTELYRHIGNRTDVPAGDIGVGAREIGYLFGQYKRITNAFEGVLTGKGETWGGSKLRPEATGYGLIYFTEKMLAEKSEDFDGKKVSVSGFGNVAWGTVKKVNELGGKVVTLSGPDGFIHDEDGIKDEKVDFMLEMRLSGNDMVKDYADRFKVPYYEGKKPWGVKVDVALPCAAENEMVEDDAKELVKNGCKCVAEGANLPLTLEASKVIMDSGILYGPGKAANAGGVACSGLEMSQNYMGLTWPEAEVDDRLKHIMSDIHDRCLQAAEMYGQPHNYVFGANVYGFTRVAEAMISQGLV
jgi:glutamate dehydrogenase (NADP+)